MNYLGYDINVLSKPRPAIRQVSRLDFGRFLVKYKNLPNFELEVNFTPFSKIFNLEPPYVLLHWQAMPKGLRTFAAYDRSKDAYLIFDYNQFKTTNKPCQLLQYDEVLINTRPTAVVYFPGSKLVKDGNYYEVI